MFGNLLTSSELRFAFFAALGTFVFWLFKKEDKSDLKMFFILRYFIKIDNGFLEFLDILLCSAIYGIITVKLFEPNLDKQAIASGLTVVNSLNYFIKRNKNNNGVKNEK